jgi:hypothetical protein
MTQLSNNVRRRLELQGFGGLPDSVLAQIDPWLRISPALCMLWATVATVLRSPVLSLMLAGLMLTGGMLRIHPFDLAYNIWIRHTGSRPTLPPYPRPRRFGYFLASFWLIVMTMTFWLGWAIAGTVLGWALVGILFANVVWGLCIPSWLHAKFFGPPDQYRL